jgi:hypothetical protein
MPVLRKAPNVACKLMSTLYELTNEERLYFGLVPIANIWDKKILSDAIILYFDGDKIVKIQEHDYGYLEYDTDIDTIDRQILLPKTSRGKQQKLTIPRILKIKGSGTQFRGSFQGGGISVYDNRKNIFFIKGFVEEGLISNYQDIKNWITNYIANIPPNYFNWLNSQLGQKPKKIKAKEGDIIAFKISQTEYGFARILFDLSAQRRKSDILWPDASWIYSKSLVIAAYAYYTDSLNLDVDNLIQKKTLPTIYIFDTDVQNGQFPIIEYKELTQLDKQKPRPKGNESYITIPYSKTDIQTFIALNGTEQN